MPTTGYFGFSHEYYRAINKLADEYEKFYLGRGVGVFKAREIARRKAEKQVRKQVGF